MRVTDASALLVSLWTVCAGLGGVLPATVSWAQVSEPVPRFEVDPTWPQPLPNQWIIGAVAGVAVDARDHVWVVHRPSTLQPNELRSEWTAAPPVLEFDQAGRVVSAWGGPGDGYEWPELEHGIFVDATDHVWLGGGGQRDAQVLKFTREGAFRLQIGRQGRNGGSNDTANLGGAANMVVDEDANELYVADGYVNHRVIVFDATTGAYKRHWGAYGRRPDDGYFEALGEVLPPPFSGAVQHERAPSQYDPAGPPPPQFRIVHAVRIARDGLVYVCDRTNDRIQVFRKDGTFVREVFIARHTLGSGSAWDVGFSTDAGRSSCTSRTAPISGSASCAGNRSRSSAPLAERVGGRVSSTGRITWPSILWAICSSGKPTRESGSRSSCDWARSAPPDGERSSGRVYTGRERHAGRERPQCASNPPDLLHPHVALMGRRSGPARKGRCYREKRVVPRGRVELPTP